jgi:hypothetical protein
LAFLRCGGAGWLPNSKLSPAPKAGDFLLEINHLDSSRAGLAAPIKASRQIRVGKRLNEGESRGHMHKSALSRFLRAQITQRYVFVGLRLPEAGNRAPLLYGRPDGLVS